MTDTTDDGDVVSLLEYIRHTRRFDFTGYKRTSLIRRIMKRMAEVRCETYADYQDYLEVHPDEFANFFDTILINVTGFFRDRPAWDFIADEIVPRIVSAKQPAEPIRVWSAGCATGQETYSLAMVLCDALGTDQFRSRVKIYGTDADDGALLKARQAIYTSKELEDAPPGYVERYFEKSNGPGAGCTDLADRPARVPQHAHVLQRRDAGPDPGSLRLRVDGSRLPVPRQG